MGLLQWKSTLADQMQKWSMLMGRLALSQCLLEHGLSGAVCRRHGHCCHNAVCLFACFSETLVVLDSMAHRYAGTGLGFHLQSHCISCGCLQVARTLTDTTGSAAGPREVAAFVTELAPVLVDKAGDNNTRVRDSASELLLWVAKRKDAGLAGMTGGLKAWTSAAAHETTTPLLFYGAAQQNALAQASKWNCTAWHLPRHTVGGKSRSGFVHISCMLLTDVGSRPPDLVHALPQDTTAHSCIVWVIQCQAELAGPLLHRVSPT